MSRETVIEGIQYFSTLEQCRGKEGGFLEPQKKKKQLVHVEISETKEKVSCPTHRSEPALGTHSLFGRRGAVPYRVNMGSVLHPTVLVPGH